MFNFLKKDKGRAVENVSGTIGDYSSLGVDMHSHVLPGIDDGAQTPADSIILIKSLIELGIKKIIATPHIMADYYRNTPASISNALSLLKAELKKENIDIKVEAAAEYYFDENFEHWVNNSSLMTMGDSFVLFEMSAISMPKNLIEIITKMKKSGYRPILAHPERYLYLKSPDYENIRSYGCLFQLNTISLTGYYGKRIKIIAENLIDKGWVDFISSDIHHLKHATALREALLMPHLTHILSNNSLKNSLLL